MPQYSIRFPPTHTKRYLDVITSCILLRKIRAPINRLLEPNGIAHSKIYHKYSQRNTAEIYIKCTGGTYIPQQNERNDTYFRMNKLPSARMTFLIYCLYVCALSNSAVPPPYFLPAREVPSKQSLTGWYNTHSWAHNRTGCIRANDQTVNASGEKCSCRGNFLTESQCWASIGLQLGKRWYTLMVQC